MQRQALKKGFDLVNTLEWSYFHINHLPIITAYDVNMKFANIKSGSAKVITSWQRKESRDYMLETWNKEKSQCLTREKYRVIYYKLTWNIKLHLASLSALQVHVEPGSLVKLHKTFGRLRWFRVMDENLENFKIREKKCMIGCREESVLLARALNKKKTQTIN